tara:strand:+ start:1320 stop:1556 length:237 start_codon:yes stop_codon:yes gene_type:complete
MPCPRGHAGATLSDRILRWARGKPFFTDEARAMFGPSAVAALVHLLDRGKLARVGPGEWKPTVCPPLPVTALTRPPDE